LEIESVAESFFSIKECEFIFKSNTEAKNRFFLLWTRKEALLKALGTGIINNLNEVEIFDRKNYLERKSFDNMISDSAANKHFIYSKRWLNYYLSIAIPVKASIGFIQLTSENISSYLF